LIFKLMVHKQNIGMLKMMKKTLTALLLSVSMGFGTAYADQATVDALQAAGIVLTESQVAEIAAAEGDELVAVIGTLIALSAPELKGQIMSAVASVSPGLVGSIVNTTTQGKTSSSAGTAPVTSSNNNASPS